MSRLLLIIAIVAVVYLLIRSYRKQAPQQDKTITAEDMVRCAHCGVHLPKGESIEADGQFFCGAGHRDAYRK
ncbi:MAG: PP0621 family protein [Gallionella sp.]|nr:PP0621 family protein [Gallionella sp.]